MTCRHPRCMQRDFDPAWLVVPALLVVVLVGAIVLAGVLDQMPAASTPGSVDAGVAEASAAGA